MKHRLALVSIVLALTANADAARLIFANQSTAANRRVYCQLVDATDGMTPETGEGGGQPQVSTDGGAWTNTGIGTLTHIGNGRYYADLTQTLVATAETWIEVRYKSAATAEGICTAAHVVAFDPAVALPTSSALSTVQSDADDIQIRLPAALTGAGNIKADAQVVSDKTGYGLTQAFPSNFSALSITAGGLTDITQAAADKAWGTTSRTVTGGTIGTYTGNTPQTGDAFARLGAPAGASVSADVAAIKVDTAAVKLKTDQLVFTTANRVDASVLGGSAPTAEENADAAWAYVQRTLTAVTGNVTIVSPVGTGGLLTLVRNDAYTAANGRILSFTSDAWENLSTFTITEIRMTARRRTSDALWFTVTDRAASRVFGSGDQTVAFELSSTDTATLIPGRLTGKYDIQVTTSNPTSVFTLDLTDTPSGIGGITVYEDQTRP